MAQQPKPHANFSHNTHRMAIIIQKRQPKQNLIRYLHAACFSPVKSTWLKAYTKGNFLTWPGLTEDLIKKHLPLSTSTVQGHLHKERQNLQSTKQTPRAFTLDTATITKQDQDAFPNQVPPEPTTHQAIYLLVDRNHITTAYQDLTGRFPVRSSQGNEYVLVGYHYDANYIHAIPVKNRTAGVLTNAWKTLHRIFSKVGTPPEVWVLDNEVSAELKQAFDHNTTTYQLVPPHSHRRNLAERAIQTFKNHFKAGLASVNPNFPLSEWDRLIPQANITLNLL